LPSWPSSPSPASWPGYDECPQELVLEASTELDETSLAGSAGALTRGGTLTLEHRLRRWLIATAAAGIELDLYQGIDRRDMSQTGAVGLEWRLSRTASLKAAYGLERLMSSVPGEDFTANLMRVGLRLQR
jgi:hypothetical protein